MKIYLQVDADNDQLYLSFGGPDSLRRAIVATTVEVATNIYADFDAKGQLVGLDIDGASKVLVDGDLNHITFDSLVGVKEAAALIGVKKSNFIRDYVNKPGFPKPVVELGSGRIWLRSQLEAYRNKRGTVQAKRTNVGKRPSPLMSTLSTLLTQDHIAFRYVVLSHFEHLWIHEASLAAPTLEEIALDSLKEDQGLLESIRTGDLNVYISSAEQLFKKYYPTSKSVVRSLLGANYADKTDSIFKEVWAEAFRQAQMDDTPLKEAGTFSRWLLGLAYESLGRYQFPIDEEARKRFNQQYDPIHATVVLENFQKATDEYERARDQIEAEKFALNYLQSLSAEEMAEFYADRHSIVEIKNARKRMMRRLRELR